jgi:hypothetical protein
MRVRSRSVGLLGVPAAAGLSALALLTLPSVTAAQRMAPGDVSTAVNVTAVSELDTDIDKGGGFTWTGGSLNVSVTRQFTQALSVGVSAGYSVEQWSFDRPTVFGPDAPWDDIERPRFGFNLGYAIASDLALFAAPQFEWAREKGASTSDSRNFGAILGATKIFSPDLVVGFGLGAFREIDRNRYFPIVIVNWQINDKLRLSNPFQAGPAGGAGFELSYAFGERWELGVGFAQRDYRFRLRDDGPVPAGEGQNEAVPLFARLTRSFGPAGQIDFYAGAVSGGKLSVRNAEGRVVQSSDYDTSPLVGVTGRIKF